LPPAPPGRRTRAGPGRCSPASATSGRWISGASRPAGWWASAGSSRGSTSETVVRNVLTVTRRTVRPVGPPARAPAAPEETRARLGNLVERGEREEQGGTSQQKPARAANARECPSGPGGHEAVGRCCGEGGDRELEGEEGRGELDELQTQR